MIHPPQNSRPSYPYSLKVSSFFTPSKTLLRRDRASQRRSTCPCEQFLSCPCEHLKGARQSPELLPLLRPASQRRKGSVIAVSQSPEHSEGEARQSHPLNSKHNCSAPFQGRAIPPWQEAKASYCNPALRFVTRILRKGGDPVCPCVVIDSSVHCCRPSTSEQAGINPATTLIRYP